MIKTSTYQFNPVKLIEEVKKRPGLYSAQHPAERDEKLLLWKEIGAALYQDWEKFNKATAYDRVLTLQRKWRSLRDAYNRELRNRKSGIRTHRRVYVYFKRMSFLGGYDGDISSEHGEEDADDANEVQIEYQTHDPLSKPKVKRTRKKRRKSSTSSESQGHQEADMTVYPIEMADGGESDKLFLLSFLPEMRQLPPNIKMWARAKIANVMQEAVGAHYSESLTKTPQSVEVKLQRRDSSD